MSLPLDYKITSETLWWGAFILAAIDTVFVTIVAWRTKPATFRHVKWLLVIMTAIFFCSLWAWGLTNFWDSVYSYVFPSWAHWIIPPIFGLLYAGISLLFWWFSVHIRGNPVVSFCLFGGFWGMITHLFAVSIGIVSKPPVLQGAAPVSAVVFAIFEFMFYWCVILSVTTLLNYFWQRFRKLLV